MQLIVYEEAHAAQQINTSAYSMSLLLPMQNYIAIVLLAIQTVAETCEEYPPNNSYTSCKHFLCMAHVHTPQ